MPNGQAAFLFLLTSALAPLIRLSYGRMVIMALPYTLVMTLTGYLMVHFFWRISLIIFTKRVRFSITKLRRRRHLKRIVI